MGREAEADAARASELMRALKLLELKPQMEQKEMSDLLGMRLRELDGILREAEEVLSLIHISDIRWIVNEPGTIDIPALSLTRDTLRVEDMRGGKLLLFTSPWNIDWATDHNKELKL